MPEPSTMPADPNRSELLREADRCVKCGLCLPGCPTYQVGGQEAESPRGRIALTEGLAGGVLPAAPELTRHLDNCLQCRHCETVCPAGVRFGELMDRARDLDRELNGRRPPAVLDWLARPATGRALRAAQRAFGWAPAWIGGRRLRGLGRAAARLGDAWPATGNHPAVGERRGAVGLFLGCVGRTLQARGLTAAIRLLTRCGVDVVVPDDQACCGAMHAHAGVAGRAAELARINGAAFAGVDRVISLASGCGAHLATGRDYADHGFAHEDLFSFLRRHDAANRLRFRPLSGRVAVHQPCTERNVLRVASAADLLGAIPGLDVVELPDNQTCCGAAGMHLLTHGALAERLRQPKLEALAGLAADWLATTNPGCALHLADGILQHAGDTVVVHPAELLAQQLRDD